MSTTKKNSRSRANEDPDIALSKKLSYVLRHGAEKSGIPIQSNGYVKLDDLKRLPNFKSTSFDHIKHVVDTNSKQRFALWQNPENQAWYIKANQGHSISLDDMDLVSITDARQFPIVIHGTSTKAWDLIRDGGGLKPMTRTHIHFAKGKFGDEGIVSGIRASANIFIYINLANAILDGVPFYVSTNGVILSPGKDGILPLNYVSKVESRDGTVLYTAGRTTPVQ